MRAARSRAASRRGGRRRSCARGRGRARAGRVPTGRCGDTACCRSGTFRVGTSFGFPHLVRARTSTFPRARESVQQCCPMRLSAPVDECGDCAPKASVPVESARRTCRARPEVSLSAKWQLGQAPRIFALAAVNSSSVSAPRSWRSAIFASSSAVEPRGQRMRAADAMRIRRSPAPTRLRVPSRLPSRVDEPRCAGRGWAGTS